MIFDKSRNLYGLNFARTSRKGNIILCEGYMDVIAMHQAGFTQAVASLGTAFTTGQASLLRRYEFLHRLVCQTSARQILIACPPSGIPQCLITCVIHKERTICIIRKN